MKISGILKNADTVQYFQLFCFVRGHRGILRSKNENFDDVETND